jgi:hypothetical protein
MRIAGIYKSFSPVTLNEIETPIRVSIARNNMIARLKLPLNPIVKPGQEPESERFAAKWRKNARGDICAKANPRIQPCALRRNADRSSASAEGQETQQPRLFENTGIFVTNRALWSSNDESAGTVALGRATRFGALARHFNNLCAHEI